MSTLCMHLNAILISELYALVRPPFIHRGHRTVQHLSDLTWRLVHYVDISKLTSFSLRLEGLDAVIETRVYIMF